MEVVRALESAARAPEQCAVTIGVYDGVHRGHIAVLRHVRELADERGLRTAVVTFDRHPAMIVHPETAPKLLTTLDHRLELLEATGLVDAVCVLTFDEARRKETAEDFVREILVEVLRARLVVVGADFHFGFARSGNVELLERMGSDLGFEAIGLDLLRVDADPAIEGSNPYSSTLIRGLVASGNVAAAGRLLGRPVELRGVVEEGDRRGRSLGFPTANVAVPDEVCMPADGIYAGTVVVAGVERGAAISIGRRPTFYESQAFSLLEAYVLDFDGDLYGQEAAVRFMARLRGEERFASTDALVAQIHRDVAAVRSALVDRGLGGD